MSVITRSDLTNRMSAVATGLEAFPAESYCPWQVANLFNMLLRQAKRELRYDAIVKSINWLEEGSSNHPPGSSTAFSGTVRVLASQVVVALSSDAVAAAPDKSTAE